MGTTILSRTVEDNMRYLGLFALIIVGAFTLSAAVLTPPDWLNECSGGLNDTDNTTVKVLAPFNGTLYAGTMSSNDQAEVWARVLLGDTWKWVVRNPDGFGDPGNLAVSSMVAYQIGTSALFMGTFNDSTGCEIWFTTNGTSFYRLHSDGLGEGTANIEAKSMAVFNNKLYVGTSNSNGLQIHEFNGTTWTVRVNGGFDGISANTTAMCMTVQDGALFVGTENSATGGEIWRSENGITWTRYLSGGWGQTSIGGITSVGGALYATVAGDNGVEVYTIGDLFSFQVNVDGFGSAANVAATALVEHAGVLVVGTQNFSGAQVWRQEGPMSWSAIASPGFGSGSNSFIPTFAIHENELFAGTSNSSGAEIWVYPGIFADGFEFGGLSMWSGGSF